MGLYFEEVDRMVQETALRQIGKDLIRDIPKMVITSDVIARYYEDAKKNIYIIRRDKKVQIITREGNFYFELQGEYLPTNKIITAAYDYKLESLEEAEQLIFHAISTGVWKDGD